MGGGLSTHESKWSPVRQRDRYRVGYRRVLSATVTTPDGPREELATRADVDRLLRTFYERALVDPLLAPVFETLAVVGLDEHLPVVGDFWEQILFRTVRYQGHFGPVHEALQVGAACGALNVVRHGLGTGGARAVNTLAERVELRRWK